MKITFDVKNQILSRTDRNHIIANSSDYLEAEITFTNDWNDLEKNMQFVNGDTKITMLLAEDDGKWVIAQDQHLNLGVGTWKVSIIGIGDDVRIITNAANLSVYASGWIGESGPVPSVYDQLLVILQSLHTEAASEAVVRSAVEDFIDTYYDELIGDRIDENFGKKTNVPLVDSQPYYGTNGQILQTNGNGSTEWVDVGTPTDEQVENAVNKWLDDHPEATTTVEDGSLTDEKFSNVLKLETIKDYVTPEMYGAAGDGITNDTDALEDAIESGKPVLLSKKYKVTRQVKLPPHTTLYGKNADSVVICESTSNLFGVSSDCHVQGIIIRVKAGFTGSVFLVNESTLQDTDITITNLCTSFDGIDVYFDGVANKHSSVFELSLISEYTASGTQKSGFYGVSIKGVNVKSAPTNLLGYFYKSFVKGATLWITGIDISDCNIYGARWSIFLGETDENIYDASVTGASTTITVTNVQHQKTTDNCKAFSYARKDSRLRMVCCTPWDWESYNSNTIPYLVAKNATENTVYTMTVFPNPKQFQIGYIDTDGTFVAYGYKDLTTLTTLGMPQFDIRMIPRILYAPQSMGAILVYRGNVSPNGNYDIVFKYLKYNTWVDVALNVGTQHIADPLVSISGDLSQGDKFYYKIDDGVLSIYLKTSNSRQLMLESAPIFGNISYSGYNVAATHYATINTFNLDPDDVFLSSLPAGVTEMTNVKNWSHGLCLRSPNGTLYKISVANDGTLSTSTWYNGYDYTWQ